MMERGQLELRTPSWRQFSDLMVRRWRLIGGMTDQCLEALIFGKVRMPAFCAPLTL